MPLRSGKDNTGSNIAEFHKGATYAHTLAKFGKATADAQAVAAGIHAAGERRHGERRKKKRHAHSNNKD